MRIPSRPIQIIGLGVTLAVAVVALSASLDHFGTKQASTSVQVTPQATPVSSPVATASPVAAPVVVGTANVNIHSTPDAIATNFVVTAWKDHPMTVLDASDANWFRVRYLTTDNQTVEGYVLKSLTTQG